MELAKYIGICGVCSGPRHNSGGSVCKSCYSKPDIRQMYLNRGAKTPLPFATYRIETVARPPRKKPGPKERIVWSGNTVPVSWTTVPKYRYANERIKAMLADRWTPGQYETIKYKAPRSLRIRVPVERRVALVYPFVAKPRDEHAELLEVNAIVPRGLPGREDVCQEIMLALWEKKITIEQVKANTADIRAFVRSFNKENYEAGGYAISLDMPMHDGRSWHDVLAAPEPIAND